MDSKNKTLVLVVVSLSWLLLVAPTPTSAAAAAGGKGKAPRTRQASIWAICKNTTNPLLCYKTIIPRVGLHFNIYNALAAEVSETHRQVLKTSSIINGLLAKPGNSKNLKDLLGICKEQYGNMLDSIVETTTLVTSPTKQNNIHEARFKFSAVISYKSACKDEFDTAAVPNPIAKELQETFDLAGNSLDIMASIEDRESRRQARKGGNNVGVGVGVGVGTPATGPCKGVIGICS